MKAGASVDALERSADAGEWDAMREHAHALKGVATNVGLVRVAALSGELMRLAEWQLAREWRQHVGTLRERLRQGRAALATRGQAPTSTSGARVDPH